jgi:mercuric ion transport protein
MKTELAQDRIPDNGVMARRVWREGRLTVPGISVALLPKLACPLCWPSYSGIVSSVGLGFLISTKYLLTLTVALLILTIGALACHAKQRRGYGPFVLGIVGAVAVLIGKFDLESNPVTLTGIVVLMMTSAWNMWPLPAVESCSCNSNEQQRRGSQ